MPPESGEIAGWLRWYAGCYGFYAVFFLSTSVGGNQAAIIGALIVSLFSKTSGTALPLNIIISALATSFFVGYGALSLLVKIVKKGHLYYFAPYCALVGILVLLAGL